jgi:hypothetical protein
VKGIAPGQSAVFYEGDDVIAGGIIQRGWDCKSQEPRNKNQIN